MAPIRVRSVEWRRRRWSVESDAATTFAATPFRVAVAAFRAGIQPHHTSIYFLRFNMRRLGIWPATKEVAEKRRFFADSFAPIITLLTVFVATVACDLHEASGDFVLFGEDLVVLIGLCLIYFKLWLYRLRNVYIENIIEQFDRLHWSHASTASGAIVERWQRWLFIGEMMSLTIFTGFAMVLLIAISVQPLFTVLRLPLRAKFPFGWQEHSQHPVVFALLYAFQCACILYSLSALLIMDNITCHSFCQVALNLRVLCTRIRVIGVVDPDPGDMRRHMREAVLFHQQIIRLVDELNDCFYWNYVCQMGASTFIICLTAFESLLAADEPMVRLKFLCFLFTGFLQLLYYCWIGNMVSFESLEVANAAYEVHQWYLQTPQLQRDLKFLIQRAQKPLFMRAKPFFPFSFVSFGSILRSSYSYFTMLRTMNN